MVYEQELLASLGALSDEPWEGTVHRHMFGRYPPDRANTRGARWNPPDVAAIYTALERRTAIAEGDHASAVQPLRPRARRTLYEIRIALHRVLDLRVATTLEALGVDDAALRSDDHSACRRVGGAVAWLGHDGLLVPSARSDGDNLVVLPNNGDVPLMGWEVVGSEIIFDPTESP